MFLRLSPLGPLHFIPKTNGQRNAKAKTSYFILSVAKHQRKFYLIVHPLTYAYNTKYTAIMEQLQSYGSFTINHRGLPHSWSWQHCQLTPSWKHFQERSPPPFLQSIRNEANHRERKPFNSAVHCSTTIDALLSCSTLLRWPLIVSISASDNMAMEAYSQITAVWAAMGSFGRHLKP